MNRDYRKLIKNESEIIYDTNQNKYVLATPEIIIGKVVDIDEDSIAVESSKGKELSEWLVKDVKDFKIGQNVKIKIALDDYTVENFREVDKSLGR